MTEDPRLSGPCMFQAQSMTISAASTGAKYCATLMSMVPEPLKPRLITSRFGVRRLGFGHIVVSEIEAPNIFANMV